MQSHALALADARVGSQWWRHLKALNREDLQEALVQEDEERWQVGVRVWQPCLPGAAGPSTHPSERGVGRRWWGRGGVGV